LKRTRLLALSLAMVGPTGCSQSGAIGGAYYAPEYDVTEYVAVTDEEHFQVIVSGNPFPSLTEAQFKQRLMAVMQAAKRPPKLTFTYDPPAVAPHPYYRLVLIFDAASDLNANRVCAGEVRHAPEAAGSFDLFATYCRNDLPVFYTTAWTQATGPDDPRVAQLMAELFLALFPNQPLFRQGPLLSLQALVVAQ
jgi:hypothetical protein